MTTDNIRILKTGTCPSLSGKSKLTFEVGADTSSTIHLRITGNSGSGAFSNAWIALDRVGQLLEKTAPITSHTLSPLFKGKSANSPGFLMAAMKHVGLVQPMVENPRCYSRLDGKAFFAEVQSLMGAKPAATPKASTTKPAEVPKARPAVYISEVHGPLVPQPRKPAKRAPVKR